MGNRIWQFILLFIGLLALQVLLFDNIELFGFLNPFVYVLFVLLLPTNISPMLTMPLAFALGLTVDLFSSTLGLHASASTILAFVRPYLLNRLIEREQDKSSVIPTMSRLGIARSARYTLLGVSMHHLALYLFAATSFDEIGKTLLHAVANILFTSLLLLVAQAIVSFPSGRDNH